jgi:hypothetical protein
MAGNIGKAIRFARTPAGRKMLQEAYRIARTEEGRKLIAQARKVASSPEGKRLILQATQLVRPAAGASGDGEAAREADEAKGWEALRRRYGGKR